MTNDPLKTERSRIRRNHKRGHYDKNTILSVLDAGIIAHISWVHEGRPACIPTLYWREGEYVYWHGSKASRMMRGNTGSEVCFSCAILDGIVLASSAFHHSANYRSVVLYGVAEEVSGDAAKLRSLKRFMDGLAPGRWEGLRPVNDKELKATKILKLKISEGAAKIRTGSCIDDPEDLSWPIWTGVVPLTRIFGAFEPDPNKPDTTVPEQIERLDGRPFDEAFPRPHSR